MVNHGGGAAGGGGERAEGGGVRKNRREVQEKVGVWRKAQLLKWKGIEGKKDREKGAIEKWGF